MKRYFMLSKFSKSSLLAAMVFATVLPFSANATKPTPPELPTKTETQVDSEDFKKAIERLWTLKQTYGISGVDDHVNAHHEHEPNIKHEQLVKVLEGFKEIEDKVAFLSSYNKLLQDPEHVHMNHNFNGNFSDEDKKYIDSLYVAYLYQLNERTKDLDLEKDTEKLKVELNKMGRETPYEYWVDDLKKVRASLAK